MPRFKSKTGLERSASRDLWKNTLSRIATVFGQLTYLAALRDGNSGVYRHHGMSSVFGREETVRALQESHEVTFFAWLNLPLAQKNADLREYFLSLEDPARTVVDHWLSSKVFASLVPSIAREMERELFSKDLEALLEIMRNGLPAEASGPGSSPHE